MTNQPLSNLKYIFFTIKRSFLPAMLFAAVLVMFFAQSPYDSALNNFFHYTFLSLSALMLIFLYILNQSKPFFSIFLGTTCYLLINWMKQKYGADYIHQSEYICLCFAFPLNFALFYFLPQNVLRSPRGKYLFLALMAEIVLIEHAGHLIQNLSPDHFMWESMPLPAVVFWLMMLAPLAIDISIKNTLLNTGLFYADSSLFMGIFYSAAPSGLTTFFCGFITILLYVTLVDLYQRRLYDYLDHVGSLKSYLSRANNKFPFKYTIALFSIDNRDKLIDVIGKHKMQVLEQMIVDKIRDFPHNSEIYRLNEAELIIVFKNEDARHVREYADNIRREIAASEFILTNKKNLKITISICVSEKTRKDLNATEVTDRAHNALKKSYRFNCNVTTVAS